VILRDVMQMPAFVVVPSGSVSQSGLADFASARGASTRASPTLRTRDFFGEMSLVTGKPRSATCAARTVACSAHRGRRLRLRSDSREGERPRHARGDPVQLDQERDPPIRQEGPQHPLPHRGLLSPPEALPANRDTL
jgi:hypothetical protein